MKPQHVVRTAVCLSIAALVLAVLTAPGSSASARRATLDVSPGSAYVAGQQLTFEGNLGVSGKQRIHLQQHMGRPGDFWGAVEGFSAMTASDGSFRFTYPAPGMFNLRMRVVAKGAATPAWTFHAQSQDLVLSLAEIVGVGDGQVLAGVPFTILVDTTPVLPGRPDLPPPAFPGRTLTLQERVDGDRWQTIATSVTGPLGNGAFVQTVDPSSSSMTYRVRQEDRTADGNAIGWFPSFPFTVEVLPDLPGPASTAEPTRAEAARSVAPTHRTTTHSRLGGATAAKINKWGVSLWDFAWAYGESLTSRPARGTDAHGWWLDSSDGSGRAVKHNGQLTLDSQRNRFGPGDIGTTAATLRGNPATYGRWETMLRLKRLESGAKDYRARIELVPDRASDYLCGAQNITVADVPVNGSTVGIGVTTRGGRQWTSTKKIDIGTSTTAFAVEVTKRHISWFFNGRVVGTVRNQAAVSDVPMTLRLSLVGDGQNEMNHTQVHSDWQRGWSLDRGELVTDGDRLKESAAPVEC